jgi:ATP-dependent DNA helicase RecG
MTTEQLHNIVKELVSLPAETQWVEFKLGRGSITNEQIGEYISAMSNGATISSKPYGYLVWGIADLTHQIKGTNFTFFKAVQGSQDLEFWIRNMLDPKISFEIFEFEMEEKKLVLLRIPAAKGEPTLFQRKPFIRIGSNKTDLRNFPDYSRIIYNSLEDWSAKLIEAATIDDLDEQALKIAREKYKERNIRASYNDQIDGWDTITFLDKAKITIKGKITNAAIVLLGKEEASHFLLPSLAEITWKLETEEKAYEHFGPPLLVNTTNVLKQIRNVKYKFFPNNELLATTVNKYDTRSILEALHNCIAHQDYGLRSRVIVTERVDRLIFINAGSFFEGTPEEYSEGDKTPEKYRNFWLANAMVNLGMIDRLGYGIHTIYQSQRNRFFPMPDYSFMQRDKVELHVYGHVIDENYSKLLIERKDLPLDRVVLLDKVQKKLEISDNAANTLRREMLIEGRKPNYYISAKIAEVMDDKAAYIKNRAFDDEHYKKMIEAFLSKFKKGIRRDFEDLIIPKLSDVLTDKQKKDKVKNILQAMKIEGKIKLVDRVWHKG